MYDPCPPSKCSPKSALDRALNADKLQGALCCAKLVEFILYL